MIQILDCTLRDGGHLVDGKFGENVIKHVIRKLVDANTDIIEVGFLMEENYTTDFARFKTIEDVKRILPKDKKNSKISLMADFVNLDNLEPYDGTIEYIRLSFKRFRLEWALKTAKTLKDKGYKVIINPVNCNVYSDQEYLEVLHKVNELHPYGFSIVDTFGVLRLRDLSRLYYLVDSNLNSDIHIGVHLHENLGLAYSLAQHFISINEGKRDIIIDGSLIGMGRVPGNLCIEQIMDHLNLLYGKNYNLGPAYDAIDDCIAPIKQKIPWGYSIPYALSAKYHLHRTYAEFLLDKWKIYTSDIENILSQVSKSESELFNEDYIENLYLDYVSIPYDDSKSKGDLQARVKNRKILVLDPIVYSDEEKKVITNYVNDNNAFIISIHFVPDFIKPDLVFFSNIKRWELGNYFQKNNNVMVSSNLSRYSVVADYEYMFDYRKLITHNDVINDDSTLMLFNLLKQMNISNFAIAGFAGYDKDDISIYDKDYNHNIDFSKIIDLTSSVIEKDYKDFNVYFLTKSKYKKLFNKEKM